MQSLHLKGTTSSEGSVRREEDLEAGEQTTGLSMKMDRRSVLLTTAASAFVLASSAAAATDVSRSKSLEDLEMGNGMWKQLSSNPMDARMKAQVPAYFATYAARFLINYDEGIASWWRQKVLAVSLLPNEQKEAKLGKAFASLARSIQIALDHFLQRQGRSRKESYSLLLQMFLTAYENDTLNDVRRQLGLLFSTLPRADQPNLTEFAQRSAVKAPGQPIVEDVVIEDPVPRFLARDLSALLPSGYKVAPVKGTDAHQIYPTVALFEAGFSEEFGQTAVATPFGPLSSQPLIRENPNYSAAIYGLFGVSGATGCALTHSVVIPLDVVKTRAQTDPEEFSDLLKGAGKIAEQEGIQGLFLGAQATLAGYFWYGLSVYPTYTFFKRWLAQGVLPPQVAMVHANDIALIAGALAAVVASMGLTPLEAARIRVVAEPDKYRALGLSGTLGAIAGEDKELGWQGLYAGLPSLLTRQVIFGSIKFLAFERASEAIFAAQPFLRDATWTSLTVSLVAGGLSGALSSVVSQPADSVLTYVAQNNRGTSSLGVIEGCRVMIEEEGLSSLFRGLQSRCLWAGCKYLKKGGIFCSFGIIHRPEQLTLESYLSCYSIPAIIAGQFLLYDVFRTIFSVSSDDLSQVYQVVLPTVQP